MFQQSNTGFYYTLNSWPPSTSASSCLGVLFSINAKFLHIQRIPNLWTGHGSSCTVQYPQVAKWPRSLILPRRYLAKIDSTIYQVAVWQAALYTCSKLFIFLLVGKIILLYHTPNSAAVNTPIWLYMTVQIQLSFYCVPTLQVGIVPRKVVRIIPSKLVRIVPNWQGWITILSIILPPAGHYQHYHHQVQR